MTPIVEVNDIEVVDLVITPQKAAWLWHKFQEYSTLFSDLTRGDVENFSRALMSPYTMWFEFRRGDEILGVAWVTDMEWVIDASCHLVFFDRQPASKVEACRQMVQWLFKALPLRRLTAMLPEMYHATIRLVEKLGFKNEGRKREAVLIGGKWNDVLIFGITRAEVENGTLR